MKEKKTKMIKADMQLDGRFTQSPDVSGYRYIFWSTSVNGTLYIAKKEIGDSPPEKVKLTLSFEKE